MTLNSIDKLATFLLFARVVAELPICVLCVFVFACPCTDQEGITTTISGVTDTNALLALFVLDLATNWSILPRPLLMGFFLVVSFALMDGYLSFLAIFDPKAKVPATNLNALVAILVVAPPL